MDMVTDTENFNTVNIDLVQLNGNNNNRFGISWTRSNWHNFNLNLFSSSQIWSEYELAIKIIINCRAWIGKNSVFFVLFLGQIVGRILFKSILTQAPHDNDDPPRGIKHFFSLENRGLIFFFVFYLMDFILTAQ